MVVFERDQEQRHQGNMIPPGIAFWRHKSWCMTVSDLFWLPMAWFWFMMIFLVNTLIVDQFPYLGYNFAAEQVDTVYLLRSRLAPDVDKWLPEKKYEEYLSSDEISKYLEKWHEILGAAEHFLWGKKIPSSLFWWTVLNFKLSISWGIQAGVMTLRNNKGERVTNPHGEPVLIVREYFMLSTSQQEDLRAQGITRHVWEKYPLAGHSVLFFTRSWEMGRMTAYVKNYHTTEEKEIYQQKLQYFEHIGWRRDVPEPYKARQGDNNPASLEKRKNWKRRRWQGWTGT